VVEGEDRGRNFIRSSEASLGLVEMAVHFAHDAEVVERVGQVRMERAVIGFLQFGGLSQEPLCGGQVAAVGRLLGGFDDRFGLAGLGHGAIGPHKLGQCVAKQLCG
jgi:hypothetical protein